MTTITTTTSDLLHLIQVGSATARHHARPGSVPALPVHLEALAEGIVRACSQDGPAWSRCYTSAAIDPSASVRAALDGADTLGLLEVLAATAHTGRVRLHLSPKRVELHALAPEPVPLYAMTNRAAAFPAPDAPAPAPAIGPAPAPPLATLPAGVLADFITGRADRALVQLHGVAEDPHLLHWTLGGYAHGRLALHEHAQILHDQAARMLRHHESLPGAD